jgi:hypothetical protein
VACFPAGTPVLTVISGGYGAARMQTAMLAMVRIWLQLDTIPIFLMSAVTYSCWMHSGRETCWTSLDGFLIGTVEVFETAESWLRDTILAARLSVFILNNWGFQSP